MSERELRQYSQMLAVIDTNPPNMKGLDQLTNSLEFLFNQLESPDHEWANSFSKEWWVLEEIYASNLDKGSTILKKEEHEKVVEAVNSIRSLITQVIGKNYESS